VPSSFLYYSSKVVLVLLAVSPGLYLLILWTSRGRQAQLRTAYLGYAVCALAIAFFQLQLYAAGGIGTILIGIVLVPITIAVTLAIGNTIGAQSKTLQLLGAGTVVVVPFIILMGFWWIAVPFTTAIAHAYEILVLVACIYRRREWWPHSIRRDA
jgi:hypothetical protein